MLSLYEILKVSKTGIAPDMWTALAGKNWGGAGSGAKIKELTGIPPLSFRADGTPLLDFLISGDMVQSGTPTSSSPIQPQECGEKTRNLFDITAFVQGIIPNRCTTSYDGTTNTLTINATGNDAHTGNANSYHIPVTGGETYTLSWGTNAVSGQMYIFENGLTDSSHLHVWNSSLKTISITMRSDTTFIIVRLGCNVANTVKTYSDIMLNTGSAPLPYEPYGYKLPITSTGQANNIYLGEVPTTRRVKKINCKMFKWEVYQAANNKKRFTALLSDEITADTTHPYSICSHIPLGLSGATFTTENCYTINADTKRIYFRLSDDIDTLSALDTFFNEQESKGTPVTIWYVLAEPETSIVNEPLRKIGDYADTISMEQAQVQIPTNRGLTTIDVATTLKPSQAYIKYRG